MTLEQQVCSLELAKRLKELGVKQESVFVYIKTKHAKGIYYVTEAIKPLLSMPDTEWYAAFTVAELGEILPDKVDSFRQGDEWFCTYTIPPTRGQTTFRANTEADARAKALI